jgi:hypothetical protein
LTNSKESVKLNKSLPKWQFFKVFIEFYWLFWVCRLFSKFTDIFLSLPIIFPSLPIFSRVYQIFIDFYWLLSTFLFLLTLKLLFFSANFYQLFLTLPTVNRKIFMTDFRLLSTSIKAKNFINFYRSKKKMKNPRCLVLYNW